MSAAKKSRSLQRRSGLSFAGADGSLDVDGILQTDIWKDVDKFEGTVAGKVQNVLDDLRDTLAQEPSSGKKIKKTDNIEKLPKQRTSLNPKDKDNNDNDNKSMEAKKRSTQNVTNISASLNATNEISTSITTKKLAAKSVTKIPIQNLSKSSSSSTASVSINKQSNVPKTIKKQAKDASRPMIKQIPEKIKNLTVQSQNDTDDAKKTAKKSPKPKDKDNIVNKSTEVIKKHVQIVTENETKNISKSLSPSVTSTSPVSMNKSSNISKTIEKKEKSQHDTDDAKKTTKKSPNPKGNTVHKLNGTIKKQSNQIVTNKVITSTPKRSPIIKIKKKFEEETTKDAGNEPGDVEEKSKIQKQHAKHYKLEIIRISENMEEYLESLKVSSSKSINKEEIINKIEGWITDMQKIILDKKKLLKKELQCVKKRQCMKNNKKIIKALKDHGEHMKAVIKKINKVNKKFEKNKSDSNSDSKSSYSNSYSESSDYSSNSESSDYSSNSESSDYSSYSESSYSSTSITLADTHLYDSHLYDNDSFRRKTKSMKKYQKQHYLCQNCGCKQTRKKY